MKNCQNTKIQTSLCLFQSPTILPSLWQDQGGLQKAALAGHFLARPRSACRGTTYLLLPLDLTSFGEKMRQKTDARCPSNLTKARRQNKALKRNTHSSFSVSKHQPRTMFQRTTPPRRARSSDFSDSPANIVWPGDI